MFTGDDILYSPAKALGNNFPLIKASRGYRDRTGSMVINTLAVASSWSQLLPSSGAAEPSYDV